MSTISTTAGVNTKMRCARLFGLLLIALFLVLATLGCGIEQKSTRQPPQTQEQKFEYGQAQLKSVLADRPMMRDILAKDHPVRVRVVELFEKKILEKRVDWEKQTPQSGQPAEHLSPYGRQNAKIRVTSAEKYSGLDKWAFLLFELENVRNATSFNELIEKARNQEVDKETFVQGFLGLELQAMKRVQDFFAQHPLPGANKENAPKYFKILSKPSDVDEFLKAMDEDVESKYDPRVYFGEYYDQLTGR